MKRLLFLSSGILFPLPLVAFAQATIQINPNLPGTGNPSTLPGVIQNFYAFALALAGIIAFGAIVYGGVRYATGKGNPSSESVGKEWIQNALLGLLLLAGAWIILYTINPNLVSLQLPGLPTLQPPPSGGGGGGGGGQLCDDLPQLAKNNNEPYPSTNAPELNTLIACIHQHVSFNAPQWTYDVSHPTCNYARGFALCDSACSHARNSCHYGGRTGSQGSLAVDFDVIGATGQSVVDAAYQYCGIPRGGYPKARCEAADGVTVPCVGGGATHVHISAASCDAN